MEFHGRIIKMQTKHNNPVDYILPIGDDFFPMNDSIGKYILFRFEGIINCISCGRKTNKSFAQGFCYPCLINAPETSECILRPQLCQAQNGIARDIEWAKKHCLQDHFVYLALSSGLKVGVTRSDQIPTRWIDQGAWKAIKLAKTPNRFIAGQIEVALKEYISDRTQWQRMLKNELAKDIELKDKKYKMLEYLPHDLQNYGCQDDLVAEIVYPVNEFPQKVKSVGFDKHKDIEGMLSGIKGQYLIFDDGRVLNIRKHNGYNITIDI